MYKNNILFLIFCFCLGPLFSQQNPIDNTNLENESKYRIGLNFGPNYNSFRGNSGFESSDPRFNITGGISFEYVINTDFSLVTNINYELKSFKNNDTLLDLIYNSSATITWTTNPPTDLPVFTVPFVEVEEFSEFHYINIPVMLRYYFGNQNIFFVNGGFFYNRLIHSNTDRKFSDELNTNFFFFDLDELFLDYDFGTTFGIGTHFKISYNSRLFFEFRYDLGLTNVVERIPAAYTNSLKFIANWSFDL